MLIILALDQAEAKEHEFESSLGNTGIPFVKQKERKKQKTYLATLTNLHVPQRMNEVWYTVYIEQNISHKKKANSDIYYINSLKDIILSEIKH